jgi:gliding motility-associated-like protein
VSAKVKPDNAHNKTIIWTTDHPEIVTINNGLLTAKQKGTATVTAKTEDGGYKAVISVIVDVAIHAPQGFSPNGDGVNDYFVCTLDSRDAYTLIVFDRSGQVHYRSPDYQNNWDGTASTGQHAGNKVPVNTYFYTLSAKNSGQVITGFVVIKY